MTTLSDDLGAGFPRLSPSNHEVTSPKDDRYNCIAHAVGLCNAWWWPAPASEPGYYWPPGVTREPTPDAFAKALSTMGFSRCRDGTSEAGFEKLALYADTQGEVTHAACSLPNGRWSSKLGCLEDIGHTIDALDGPVYGGVIAWFRRPLPTPAPVRLRQRVDPKTR